MGSAVAGRTLPLQLPKREATSVQAMIRGSAAIVLRQELQLELSLPRVHGFPAQRANRAAAGSSPHALRWAIGKLA